MKINNENLGASQLAVGIVLVAMASRFGDTLTAEFFGWAVRHVGWRGVILGLGFTMLVAALTLWVADARTRAVEAQEGRDHPVLVPLSERVHTSVSRLKDFYSMEDTWLVTLVCMGQQPFWTFSNYFATFAHSVYDVRPHQSALVQGMYPAGQFLALCGALSIALPPGVSHRRRKLYALTAGLGTVAAMIPWIILFAPLSLEVFVGFGFLQGITTAMIDYIPLTMWCTYVGNPTGDTSLYLAATLFFSYMFSFGNQLIVGYWRTISETDSFELMLEVACAGGIISAVAIIRHVKNQWSTDFLDSYSSCSHGDLP